MSNSDIQSKSTSVAKDYQFENAKAFLIITVVLGHFLSTILNYASFEAGAPKWVYVLFKTIYVFHMPVFMAISGRFAKRRIDSNDYISVVKKVLIPYITADTLLMIFSCAIGYSSFKTFSYLSPMFGLWYLFNIAVYQFISPYIVKYKYAFWISFVVAIAANFFKDDVYGGFHRLITFYPFFLFGYYTATKSFSFCKKTLFRIASVLSFLLLILLIIVSFDFINDYTLTLNKVYSVIIKSTNVTKPEYLLIVIIRYILGFAFFIFTMGIVSTKKNILSRLGTYSIYIYILHLFVVVFIRTLDKHYGLMDRINTNVTMSVFCAASILLAFVLVSRPIRKMTEWFIEPHKRIPKQNH